MDENEMMIIINVAEPNLRERLLELYRRDKAVESTQVDCCPNCYTYLQEDNGVLGEFCPNCGQRINIKDRVS